MKLGFISVKIIQYTKTPEKLGAYGAFGKQMGLRVDP